MNSPPSRKRSDCKSETRLPRNRDKNNDLGHVTSSVGAGGLTSRKRKIDPSDQGHGSRDAMEVNTESSSGDGSSTSLPSTQAKISRPDVSNAPVAIEVDCSANDESSNEISEVDIRLMEGLGDQTGTVFRPSRHSFTVQICDSSLLHRSKSLSDFFAISGATHGSCDPMAQVSPSGSQATATGAVQRGKRTHRLRVECELGDVWFSNVHDKERVSHVKISSGNPCIDKAYDVMQKKGFAFLSLLANGAFSLVHVVSIANQQKLVATKLYQRTPGDNSPHPSILETYCGEAIGEKRLKHINIIEILETIHIDKFVIEVMELCEVGSLEALAKATSGHIFSEAICRGYFKDMVEGVAFLHASHVAHRDIKCQHFLVDRHNRVKLTDFRQAIRCTASDTQQSERTGTRSYWSPEMLQKFPHSPFKGDLWALGVCLHLLLTSRFPYCSDHPEEAKTISCMRKGLDFKDSSPSVHLSKEAVELIKGILHFVIQVRYTINRIRCSDWMTHGPVRSEEVKKPYIGSYFLLCTNRKHSDSPEEKLRKDELNI